jgi:uncharacterized protein YndB with AHSA1/START domain
MKIELSREFACTPEQLWPYLNEPDKIVLWMKGLEGLIPDRPGPVQVGSTYTLKIREGGRIREFREEITALDPPRHIALQLSGGSLPQGNVMEVDYRVGGADGRTRVDYLCSCEMKGIYRLMAPLGTAMARRQVGGFFDALERLLQDPVNGAGA